MNRAVNHVSRFIDVVVGVGLPDDLAVDVDLYQAGSGDFLVEEAVEIEQKHIFLARNARGDVVIDEIGHVVDIDEAITGGEIEPRLPLLWRNSVLDRREIGRIIHGVVLFRRALTRPGELVRNITTAMEASQGRRSPLYMRSRLPISPRPRRSSL